MLIRDIKQPLFEFYNSLFFLNKRDNSCFFLFASSKLSNCRYHCTSSLLILVISKVRYGLRARTGYPLSLSSGFKFSFRKLSRIMPTADGFIHKSFSIPLQLIPVNQSHQSQDPFPLQPV
jgi:hypothetical protein